MTMSSFHYPKLGPVIAIDGPAGTGKSTATKRLADLLQYTHIDTGSLYRAIAYLSSQHIFEASTDGPTAEELSQNLSEIQKRAIEVAHSAHLEFRRHLRRNPKNRIYANGKDVTPFIRTPEMSMIASQVSSIPEVRAALLGMQRRLGAQGKTILEGRDIGTVIFPDADLKFFLNADVEERAKRRMAELEATGADAPSFEELKRQIRERDEADMKRVIAPLKKANDAIEIDTTKLTLDEVVEAMAKIIREKVKT